MTTSTQETLELLIPAIVVLKEYERHLENRAKSKKKNLQKRLPESVDHKKMKVKVKNIRIFWQKSSHTLLSMMIKTRRFLLCSKCWSRGYLPILLLVFVSLLIQELWKWCFENLAMQTPSPHFQYVKLR